jgi:integrase
MSEAGTRPYKKNRETWGKVTPLPSKKFQASYLHEGERHYAPMTYSARVDARAFNEAARKAIEKGTWKNPKTASAESFGVYAATWVAERTSSKGVALRPKTRAEYLRQLDKGLSAFAGDQLTAITPARVRTWHGKRLEAGHTMAGAEARLLRAILNTAVEDGIIQSNPVPAKLTKSSSGQTHRPPTLDELATLVENVDERFQLGVLVAAFGGLRLSEWRALRRRDLALVNGRYEISVTRQAQHVFRTGWTVGAPKSDHGIRTVTLPKDLTTRVDAHLSTQVGSFPDALLFAPKGTSEFIHDSDFNKSWNTARDAAGVRTEVREHDLRGFAGSHLVASGANAFEARDYLGHANVRTTETHYIRKVTEGAAARAAELADKMPQLPKAKPSKVTQLAPKTKTA